MVGTVNLDQDFKEFLRFCGNHNVSYLIVGGYALAAHGHPRFTKDLDVWLQSNSENAKRLMEALNDFGFGDLDLSEETFIEPNIVVQLGYPPKRIDLLTSVEGVEFDDCFARAVFFDIDGLQVPFINIDDLKINKSAAGRPQDLADIAALESDEKN